MIQIVLKNSSNMPSRMSDTQYTVSVSVCFLHFPKSLRAAVLMIHHHFMFHYTNRNSTPGKIKHRTVAKYNLRLYNKTKRKATGAEMSLLGGAKLQRDSIF